MIEALDRWGYTPRRWRLGEVAEATVPVDRDRLAVALDALLENAIAHTNKDDRIELSARVEDGHVILAVADSGCGIPEPTWSGSSACSPARLLTGAGRPAGSGSGCRRWRRSPKPTMARSG